MRAGIPVMGHIGWTPQAKYSMGGKTRVQGKDRDRARSVMADALAVQEAGAFAVVLELIPAQLSAAITERLRIPTIGIGAGRRLLRTGPGDHRPAGAGHLHPAARPAVRAPRGDHPRLPPRPTPRTSPPASFPGRSSRCAWTTSVLADVLGGGALDRAGTGELIAIPLDQDL